MCVFRLVVLGTEARAFAPSYKEQPIFKILELGLTKSLNSLGWTLICDLPASAFHSAGAYKHVPSYHDVPELLMTALPPQAGSLLAASRRPRLILF